MNTQEKISRLLDKLITEGDGVLRSRWESNRVHISGCPETFVEQQQFKTWQARCKFLPSLLGKIGEPWEPVLNANLNYRFEHATTIQSTLLAIKQYDEEGLLLEIEDLVLADAFANLLEQAKYLLENKYYLAAGVILRAVLEERLKSICNKNSLEFSKTRPTLKDYNTEIYTKKIYDKITFKEIDVLISIGNDAAHNNNTLDREKVKRMLDGTTAILLKFS